MSGRGIDFPAGAEGSGPGPIPQMEVRGHLTGRRGVTGLEAVTVRIMDSRRSEAPMRKYFILGLAIATAGTVYAAVAFAAVDVNKSTTRGVRLR